MKSGISEFYWCLITTGLLCLSQNSLAEKIYQWTDTEGVVHFSDIAPTDGSNTDVAEINIVKYANSEQDPDQYSIINQLELMAGWSRATEDEQRSKRQMDLAIERQQAEPVVYEDTTDYQPEPAYYYPTYYYPAYRYHRNRGDYKWHYPDSFKRGNVNNSRTGIRLEPGEVFYNLQKK